MTICAKPRSQYDVEIRMAAQMMAKGLDGFLETFPVTAKVRDMHEAGVEGAYDIAMRLKYGNLGDDVIRHNHRYGESRHSPGLRQEVMTVRAAFDEAMAATYPEIKSPQDRAEKMFSTMEELARAWRNATRIPKDLAADLPTTKDLRTTMAAAAQFNELTTISPELATDIRRVRDVITRAGEKLRTGQNAAALA